MKRSFLYLALIALFVAAPSSALAASKISSSLGNLRWGMSDSEVTTVVKKALKKEYAAKLKKAKGMSKSSLESEYKRRIQDFEKSLVEFNGRSRWDSSAVGDEYTHGNEESMLVLEGKGSNNYYFFIEGRLWKWVRTMPSSTFGGYKKFSKSIKKKFGNGHDKNGESTKGSGQSYDYVEFLDRNNRLRAVDKTSNHGEYALVFEEMATVRNLSSLRMNTPKRSSKSRSSAVASNSKPSRATTLRSSRSSKRKSIFSDERGDESESAYEARKRKVLEERKRKQRALFEREQDSKKGKVLDELQGMDDDDPLSGMR